MARLKEAQIHFHAGLCISLSIYALFLVSITSFNPVAAVATPRVLKVSTPDEGESYNKYYNYADLTRLLKSLASKYPHIANLSSIGQSVQNRELWVMRITKDPNADLPGKPKVKYVGNMHGDETISRQVLVYLVEYLLDRYGSDPRVTELINTTDIYIMPSMNPDGFEKSVEGDCAGNAGGRENAKNKDLNRSFPDQFDVINVHNEDIPEVTAVIKWILDNK